MRCSTEESRCYGYTLDGQRRSRDAVVVYEMFNGGVEMQSLYIRCSTDESRYGVLKISVLTPDGVLTLERTNSTPSTATSYPPNSLSLSLLCSYQVEVLQKSFEELKEARARDKELIKETKEENRKQYEEKLKSHALTMKEEMVKEANAKIAEMRCLHNIPNNLSSPSIYEWKVFGHFLDECPKNIVSDVLKNLKNSSQAAKDVQVGPKVAFKPIKQVYRPVPNRNKANLSGKMKQVVVASKEVSNSNPFDVLNLIDNYDDLGTNGGHSKSVGKGSILAQIIDEKLTLVDDDGKPLPKVVSTANVDSDSEVKDVVDDHVVFMASTGLKRGDDSGYGTNSLIVTREEVSGHGMNDGMNEGNVNETVINEVHAHIVTLISLCPTSILRLTTSMTKANLQKLDANVPNDTDYDVYDNLVMVVPNLEGTRDKKETICVESEWEPPRCSMRLIFGHPLNDCPKVPKRVMNGMDKGKGGSSEADDEGFIEVKQKRNHVVMVLFPLVTRLMFKMLIFPVIEEVEMGNKASTSGVQEEGQRSTPLVEKINIFEKQMLEGKCVLVDDDGKPMENIDYSSDHGSEDEVESVERNGKLSGFKTDGGGIWY
ncbi:hypothetical protein Tco_1468247 [Tanacetum coccineum]